MDKNHFENRKIFLNSSIEGRGQDNRYLIMNASNKCNNSCLHCSLKQKKESEMIDAGRFIELLRRNKDLVDSLFLKDGELAIRKDFFLLMEKALECNFREIRLETNGRIFAYKEFCERLINLANTKNDNSELTKLLFVIKLQGPTAEIHDSITQVKNSFQQTLHGIKNLVSLKQKIIVNIPISKLNYKLLPSIISLIKNIDENIKILISVIEPEAESKENFWKVMPVFSELKEDNYLEKAIRDNARRIILDSMTIPFCLFPNLVELQSCLVSCNHNTSLIVNDDSLDSHYQREFDTKTKENQCNECEYSCICSGFNKEYVKKNGFDCIEPFVWDKHSENECLKNLYALGTNIQDYRADSIILFSGGLDSTIASSLYAKNNPDKKIILVSYLPSYLIYAERAKKSANELIAKYLNIICHLIIPEPSIFPKKLFLNQFKKEFQNKQYCEICLPCRAIWATLTVYLAKKIFRAKTVVFGSIYDDFRFEKQAAIFSSEIFKSFYKKYSIELSLPTLFYKKSELYELAKKENFSGELLDAFDSSKKNNKTQAFCMLESLKIGGAGSGTLNKLGFCKKPDEKFFEFGEEMLSSEGIFPSN